MTTDPLTEKLLRRVGYYASLARHGRAAPRSLVPFPDLSTGSPPIVSMEEHFANPAPRRPPLPPDAIRFPVGHSHKQGTELITPGSDPAHYAGRKF